MSNRNRKPNIVVRMGAAHYDATVMHNGEPLYFNLRTMERKERSAFHRELMNAFRTMRKA